MLQEQYEEWQHNENKELLANLLGVSTYEDAVGKLREDVVSYQKYLEDGANSGNFGDIRQGITGTTQVLANNFNDLNQKVMVTASGLERFNSALSLNGDTFFSYLQNSFKSIFETLMETHATYQLQYHNLLRETLSLLSANGYLELNNAMLNSLDDLLGKTNAYKDLFEVVKYDKNQIATKPDNNVVTDPQGWVDYSAMMVKYAANHDMVKLKEAAILREVKYNKVYGDKTWEERGWTTTDTLLDNLMKENGWSEEEVNSFYQDFTNVASMVSAAESINQQNQAAGLDLLSTGNQIAYTVLSTIPASQQESAATLLAQMIADTSNVNGTLTTTSYNLSSGISYEFNLEKDFMKNLSDAEIAQRTGLNKEIVSAIREAANQIASSKSTQMVTTTNGGGSSSGSGVANQSVIEAAQAEWHAADEAYKSGELSKEAADAIKDSAHKTAEAERAKENYSGGDDGTQHIELSGSHAQGLETGPVTYTGLAMLHGTPARPEFVLNTDQAYNILRYIASGKRPSEIIDSTNNITDTGVQYIVEGDIVLEGLDDPAEFWDGVTTAMSNRWNVTKKR